MPSSSGPCPVAPGDARAHALHTAASSRRIEEQAAARRPPHRLMQLAGEAVGRLALAIAPHARAIWIAAGPGNNGGDGMVAARWLHQAGRRVTLSLVGDPDRLPPDARHAWAQMREAGVPVVPAHEAQYLQVDLVIDALLGLGVARPPTQAMAQAIATTAAHAAPVLAVDLPSGLHPDTGQPLGDVAVRADHTLSLLTLKPGLFTGAGRDLAGQVWLDRLGVADAALPPDAHLTGGSALAPWQSVRPHQAHKGSFGDVLAVGGDDGMTGAAMLAGLAALAAGAGRVHVDLLSVNAGTIAPDPGLMMRPGMGTDAAALARATVVCGCGGGQAVAQRLPVVLDHAARLVLDADALNALAAAPALRDALVRRGRSGRPTLLTPHPLEAARLLSTGVQQVQADRMSAAQRLADACGCAVLLKGSGSVCAAPGALPWLNPTGNALLATAGTGDVLAGWAAGLWAQCAQDAADAAQRVGAAAAWGHGRAADLAREAGRCRPLAASALADAMASLRA